MFKRNDTTSNFIQTPDEKAYAFMIDPQNQIKCSLIQVNYTPDTLC